MWRTFRLLLMRTRSPPFVFERYLPLARRYVVRFGRVSAGAVRPLRALDPMKSTIILNRGRQDARRSAHANGFTLMELLIVMAIIAILMLIAIPTMGNMKRYANELSAQQ